MKVIRGTGDARRMQKGLVQGSTVSTRPVKCTHCGNAATPSTDTQGNITYSCGKCGAGFKLQKM